MAATSGVQNKSYNHFIRRLTFHGKLLMSWPFFSAIELEFTVFDESATFALVAVARLAIVCLLLLSDYLTIQRSVSTSLFFFIEFSLVIVLLFPEFYWAYSGSSSAAQTVGWFIGLTIHYLCYLAYLIIFSVVNLRNYGKPFSPFFALHTFVRAESSMGKRTILDRIIGRRRRDSERLPLEQRCYSIIFDFPAFRKHPFEPSILAIVRGILALYATQGIFVYAILLVNLLLHSPSTSVQTALAWDINPVCPNVVVVSANLDRGNFSNLYITQNGTSLSTIDCPSTFGERIGSDNCSYTHDWAFIYNGAISHDPVHLSVSSGSPLSIWIMGVLPPVIANKPVNDTKGSADFETAIASAMTFTESFVLAPNTQFAYGLSTVQKEHESQSWSAFTPYIIGRNTSISQDSNTSHMDLSCYDRHDWMLYRYPSETIGTSTISAVLQIISTLGGAFTTINGLYFVIFGRGIWDVISGARPVSPFGVFGWLSGYKRKIHETYPLLQEDCDKGGLASFIADVSIDVGIRRRSNPQPIEANDPEATDDPDNDSIPLSDRRHQSMEYTQLSMVEEGSGVATGSRSEAARRATRRRADEEEREVEWDDTI